MYTVAIGDQETSVYCDMRTAGGGWLVFQRRSHGSLSFERTWQEYEDGFGDMHNGDFWLGNELLHQITQSGQYLWA